MAPRHGTYFYFKTFLLFNRIFIYIGSIYFLFLLCIPLYFVLLEIVLFIRQKQYISDQNDDELHLDLFELSSEFNNEVFNQQIPTLFAFDDELDDDETYTNTEDEIESTESTDSETQTEAEHQSQQLFTPPLPPAQLLSETYSINTPGVDAALELDLSSLFDPVLDLSPDFESAPSLSLCFTLQYDPILSPLLTTRFDLCALIFTYSLPPSTAISSRFFSADSHLLPEYSAAACPAISSFYVSMEDTGQQLVPAANLFPEPESKHVTENKHPAASSASNEQVMSGPAAMDSLPFELGLGPEMTAAHSSGTLASSSVPSLVPLDESALASTSGFFPSNVSAAVTADPNASASGWRSSVSAVGAAANASTSAGGIGVSEPSGDQLSPDGGGSASRTGGGASASGAAAVGEELSPPLPRTVTRLVNPRNGARVYIVGTAHFSSESQEDVRKVC